MSALFVLAKDGPHHRHPVEIRRSCPPGHPLVAPANPRPPDFGPGPQPASSGRPNEPESLRRRISASASRRRRSGGRSAGSAAHLGPVGGRTGVRVTARRASLGRGPREAGPQRGPETRAITRGPAAFVAGRAPQSPAIALVLERTHPGMRGAQVRCRPMQRPSCPPGYKPPGRGVATAPPDGIRTCVCSTVGRA